MHTNSQQQIQGSYNVCHVRWLKGRTRLMKVDKSYNVFTIDILIGSFIAAVIILLSGCSARGIQTTKTDIKFIPADKTSQSVKLFRQQLMYCTTQYLAETRTIEASVSWQLSEKELRIKSPDSRLQHYLSVCAEDSVYAMGSESDQGTMEVSGKPELAETQRM